MSEPNQPLLNAENGYPSFTKPVVSFDSGVASPPPGTCPDCRKSLTEVQFCGTTGRAHSPPPPMLTAAAAAAYPPAVSAPFVPPGATGYPLPTGSQHVPMQSIGSPSGSTFDVATMGVESMGAFSVFEDEKVTFATKHAKCCESSSLMISDRRVVMRSESAICCCPSLPRSVWIASLPAEAADVGVQTIRVPSAFWRKVVFVLSTISVMLGLLMLIFGLLSAQIPLIAFGSILMLVGYFFIFVVKAGCWCCCLVTTIELAFNRRVPGTWYKTFWQHMRGEEHSAQCEAAFRALRPSRKMVESEHVGHVGVGLNLAAV
eukprot:TRINITY_DN837_c0_g1_i1.p1 TRINITY_DN837_c0_g1~~TRINITY_DN837_c0_g1_i1.p1  ORF type:complete len:317 (+),score=37.58 TRINITY_DN837_c0_g1_i1:214-1164(+)